MVDVVAPHAGKKVPAPVPKCAAQYSVDVLDSKVGCRCSRSEGEEGATFRMTATTRNFNRPLVDRVQSGLEQTRLEHNHYLLGFPCWPSVWHCVSPYLGDCFFGGVVGPCGSTAWSD